MSQSILSSPEESDLHHDLLLHADCGSSPERPDEHEIEELTCRPRGDERQSEIATVRAPWRARRSCIQTRLESRTTSMTIRSKIFEKFVEARCLPRATRLSYNGVWRMVLFPAQRPKARKPCRVCAASTRPSAPVARSSPGLPRLPPRRLFDSCTHISPGHAPHTAGACPMCHMRHRVGLGRALSYRSLCAVPQSSNSIETGPWTELRSPPPGCASMFESDARNSGLVGTRPGRERRMVECTSRRRLVPSSAISASPCGRAEERRRTWRRRRSQRRRRCRCRAQWPRRPSNRTRAPHARY